MIVLKDVSKTLDHKKVLKEVSFHIAKNEKVGLIGLNGAGKTTLLDVIAGVKKPDAGFVRTNERESVIEDPRSLREFFYLSGTRSQLWQELTVKASLEHCMRMYQIEPQIFTGRLEKLERVFEIGALMNRRPEHLSLGERMRCELVYALLAESQILLLDEVLIGVDVAIKHKILQFFENYRKEGQVTIIYTSNDLSEVEKLCDRVILIHEGEILFDGKTKRLINEYSPYYRMEAEISGAFPDLEDLPLENYRLDSDRLIIHYDKQKIDTTQVLEHLMKTCRLEDVRLHEPDLEGTIQRIYGGRTWKTS